MDLNLDFGAAIIVAGAAVRQTKYSQLQGNPLLDGA
jgi:hypothetical protein